MSGLGTLVDGNGGSITIAPLSAVSSVYRRLPLSHAVSILGPQDRESFPYIKAENLLRLEFDDVGYTSDFGQAASPEDISKLISFARSWAGLGNLLIHCRAGTSRSPAAALIALAAIESSNFDELAKSLLLAKNYYRPNSTMLRLADQHLSTGSSLLALARGHVSHGLSQEVGPATIWLGK
jgi:predicted protein tyrosine phosphatase